MIASHCFTVREILEVAKFTRTAEKTLAQRFFSNMFIFYTLHY